MNLPSWCQLVSCVSSVHLYWRYLHPPFSLCLLRPLLLLLLQNSTTKLSGCKQEETSPQTNRIFFSFARPTRCWSNSTLSSVEQSRTNTSLIKEPRQWRREVSAQGATIMRGCHWRPKALTLSWGGVQFDEGGGVVLQYSATHQIMQWSSVGIHSRQNCLFNIILHSSHREPPQG